MKKGLKVVLVAFVLIVFGLMAAVSCVSCSDSGEKKDIVAADGTSSSAVEETEEVNTDASTGSENASAAKSEKVSINQQVVVDRDGLKITAMEYTTDSIWGDGIKLLIENGTSTTYTVGCDALIVNDYMISDLFVSEIAPGKKANETMYLSSSELKAAGIDTVGKVEMYFHAYTSDNLMDYLFQNEYCEIQTSAYANMDTTPNDAGMELYNQNGIRIVGKTVDEDSFWGKAILLYIENTSGVNAGINVDEMSINGFMMDPIFSTTCYNGKKAIDDITLLSSDLESNGIESIDQVELKFHIYNGDTYETIADSDPITFSAR